MERALRWLDSLDDLTVALPLVWFRTSPRRMACCGMLLLLVILLLVLT